MEPAFWNFIILAYYGDYGIIKIGHFKFVDGRFEQGAAFYLLLLKGGKMANGHKGFANQRRKIAKRHNRCFVPKAMAEFWRRLFCQNHKRIILVIHVR